ncbi:MAG: biotin/lipoyl-binding protein [Bacteroidetes bacterium]|nr:biotin/lipoyl-binding protein [Bacteroidota bacterium]
MKRFKFSIRGHDYEVEVKSLEGNYAEIEVNGTVYEVELLREVSETKTPKLVRKPVVLEKGAGEIKKDEVALFRVKAPLPGTIMHILVKPGDKVAKGDKLLIYEAMKMENNILAEKDGTIRSIKVTPGQNVLQDDILLEIE